MRSRLPGSALSTWSLVLIFAIFGSLAACTPRGDLVPQPRPPADGEPAPGEPDPTMDPADPDDPRFPPPREPADPADPEPIDPVREPRPEEPEDPREPPADPDPEPLVQEDPEQDQELDRLREEEAEEDEELVVATTTISTVVPATREPTAELIDQLTLPPGFQIGIFAEELENPRIIEVTGRGHIYVSEREAGRVTLLRDSNGDGEADERRPVAEGLGEKLRGVHGLASRGDHLFMVTETELFVAEIRNDGSLGQPQLLLDDIPDGGQHPNRTMRWGPDGMLYLSVGSTCNACVEPNEEHATLIRIDPESGQREVFAEGLRNTIGFDWHPRTGRLYGLDHNTDERGDDWPPEELNLIEEGMHYGWPHCWGDRQVDPHLPTDPPDGRSREEFCEDTEAPVLTYIAHGAPMQMAYYDAGHFPAEYQGDAFATMRGSWNRNPPVGYEVVRIIHDEDGNPVDIESFVSGWLIEGGAAHFGRLTGLAVTPDGSILVSADENGVIYRIWHGERADDAARGNRNR